jgi:hypothetical protein
LIDAGPISVRLESVLVPNQETAVVKIPACAQQAANHSRRAADFAFDGDVARYMGISRSRCPIGRRNLILLEARARCESGYGISHNTTVCAAEKRRTRGQVG